MHAALCADLHGSFLQYKLLRAAVKDYSIDVLFLAGDIGPGLTPDDWRKLPPTQWPSHLTQQRYFYNWQLPGDKKTRGWLEDIGAKVYLIQGNDDSSHCLHLLQGHEPTNGSNSGWVEAHGRRIPLGDRFDVVGYSHVSFTPHVFKDWEKAEYETVPERWRCEHDEKLRYSRTSGVVSNEHRLMPSPTGERSLAFGSIEADLASPVYTDNPERSVWLFHAPPYGTGLDIVYDGKAHRDRHVGSLAVRDAIKHQQPYLFLCGHIHETYARSGRFMERIGRTVCLTASNGGGYERLAFVHFDMDRPEEAQRVLLPD
jgi:uncharacterized protein